MLTLALASIALLCLPGVHGLWQASKIESTISAQSDQVDQAESLATKLQLSQKKVTDLLASLELAKTLEEERLQWPKFLEELAKRSKSGMWITKLSLLSAPEESKEVSPGKKTAGDSDIVPRIEISGLFETKSEEADSQVIDLFVKSLQQDEFLKKIEMVELETPERSVDGTAEQVALKFTMRADWIQEKVVKAKPANTAKPK